MEKISEKLNIIKNSKDDIKTAIENKGVTVGDVGIESYADKINQMQVTDFEINDCSYLFNNGARMDIIDKILKLCKNVISTNNMFGGSNANYETLDLSNFDTSNVTDMSYMFYYNGKLKNVNLSNFDTSNVKNMSFMFSYSGLQSLDLSNFDMSNVTSMTYMFQTCQSLTSLILGDFDTSKIHDMTGTFYYLSRLKDLQEIDLSGCKNVLNIMKGCSSLENFGGLKNYGKAFNAKQSNVYNYKLELNTLTSLTHDSLMNIINKLYDLNLTYDVANGGTLYTQQIVIGADNIAKLSDEEISIATAKGWVVS